MVFERYGPYERQLNYGKCRIQYFGAWPILGTISDISAVSVLTILTSHKSSNFMEILNHSRDALTWLDKNKITTEEHGKFGKTKFVSLNTISFVIFRSFNRDFPHFKFKGFSVLTRTHLWKHWILVSVVNSLILLVLVFIDLYWLNHIVVGA